RELFIGWANEHYAETNERTFPENLRGPWAKMEGYCARLALIVQLCRWAAGEVLDEDVDRKSVAGAAALIEYFKSHARRVYTRLPSTEEDRHVAAAVEWIRKRPNGVASLRDVLRNGVGGVKSKREAIALFAELEIRGYGEAKPAERNSLRFFMD